MPGQEQRHSFPTRRALWRSLADFGRMVKLSHTVFALPFALAAAALAAHGHGITRGQVLAIRSQGMAQFFALLTPDQKTKAVDFLAKVKQVLGKG